MLEREAEPELMTDGLQARAYAEADFAEPNELFCKSVVALPLARQRRFAVDLGCGPADIPIRLASRLPQLEIVAVDGSAAMLKLAERALTKAQLTHRIRLLQSEIGSVELPQDADLVLSNSLLHHLHDPALLWQSARRLASPDAQLVVMDLARPESSKQLGHLVDTYAAGAPEVLRRDFANSLRAAYTHAEVTKQLRDAGLSHLSVVPASDRHWLVRGSVTA